MAQPIALHLAARDPQGELSVKLQQAPREHGEALLAAYEVLQSMHDAGVLELMRGTLGGGEKIVEEFVAVTRSAAAIRASRNLLLLIKALAELEPDRLSDFTRAVPKALVQANAEDTRPPSLFKLLNTFRNKDFRRGLAACNDLLIAFGKNLTEKSTA